MARKTSASVSQPITSWEIIPCCSTSVARSRIAGSSASIRSRKASASVAVGWRGCRAADMAVPSYVDWPAASSTAPHSTRRPRSCRPPSVPSRNRLRLHALGPCEAISSRGLASRLASTDSERHNSTLPNCASNADARGACNWRTGVIRSARPGEPCPEHFESCAGISVTAPSFACGQTKWSVLPLPSPQYHRNCHLTDGPTATSRLGSPIRYLASLVASNLKLSQSENPVCFWISVRRSDSFE